MKKLILLTVVGIFSFASFAANGSIENEPKIEENNILLNIGERATVKVAAFPVYCDGVYAGDADTIKEALGLCD